MAKYSLSKQDSIRKTAEALVLFIFEGDKKSDRIKSLDKKLKGKLNDKLHRQKFEGQFSKVVIFDTVIHFNFNALVIVGLGKKSKFSSLKAYRIGNVINKKTREQSSSLVIDFSNIDKKYLKYVVEGIEVGNYKYNKLKTSNDDSQNIDEVTVCSKKISNPYFNNQINYAICVADSIKFTRDLVNDPPNKLTPSILSEHAVSLVKNNLSLDCKVFDENEIVKMGMGGLNAVSLGSDEPPRFIHISYISKKKTKNNIAIVGKGITFDSGGLCLKPSDSMRTMKMDMAGAAVVLGVMKSIGELKPDVNVHGLIPTTENMTGGSAYKPDDVINALNGKSIEIINTDAEGRVALSDALSYAVKNKMTEIIDLATLTGACIVGLGLYTAGVMGNNKKLIDSLLEAAELSGEKMWQLPLDDELRKEIKSSVADLKNVGSRWGGAITAALFLENFVGDTPWAHIDIAGPSFIEKQNDWYPNGATGFGVSTIIEYLMKK